MEYFNGLTDATFKTDAKGNTIFYPFWIFGKGYILPGDNKNRFRLTMKRHLLTCVLLAIAFSMFLNPPLFFFIILPLYFSGYTIWVKKRTAGLAISSVKLTLSDSTGKSARPHNWTTFGFLDIVSFLFVLATISILGHLFAEWVKK
jgi:hypothetical protein